MKTYIGNETKKALKNFPFSGGRVSMDLIRAIVEIKKAAAQAHAEVREIDWLRANAVIQAADELLKGKFDREFQLPALQGGAGTSINMNVNEVVANRAEELISRQKNITPHSSLSLGAHPSESKTYPPPRNGVREMLSQRGGELQNIHPNDHVNKSQSTNDVNPSALRLVTIRLNRQLVETLQELAIILGKKAKQFQNISKLGRTHLQDAVPTTLGAEFAAAAENIRRGIFRLKLVERFLLELNLGGTAIGNSINASPRFIKSFYKHLSRNTKLPVRPASNLMALTSGYSDFLFLSQAIVAVCADASKFAGDLRLLSSGPRGSIGEISLPELQAGSSIMPGKVNPILCETVNQLYFLVSGNNLSIEQAAHAAQLELNTAGPIMAERLIQSLVASREVLGQFAKKCVTGIMANAEACRIHLEHSTAYATLLVPKFGYETVSRVVKTAVAEGKSIREIVLREGLLKEKEFNALFKQ